MSLKSGKKIPPQSPEDKAERGTPPALFEALDREFDFTLDACASKVNCKVKNNYFTKKDNAFAQPWYGRVWVNPPFRGLHEWTHKIVEEIENGNAELIVALFPTSQDAKADEICEKHASEIRKIKERVPFHNTSRGEDRGAYKDGLRGVIAIYIFQKNGVKLGRPVWICLPEPEEETEPQVIINKEESTAIEIRCNFKILLKQHLKSRRVLPYSTEHRKFQLQTEKKGGKTGWKTRGSSEMQSVTETI
jgi:site-specific DNA-methyltransferase (adenine-specific)